MSCVAALTVSCAAAPFVWKGQVPDDPVWLKSEEARALAENLLLYQYPSGGWTKNRDMAKPLSDSEKEALRSRKDEATIDNGGTHTQVRALAPGDLAGMKIRVQESPMAIAMVRALGGSATPIAWGELYTALQQGVVDGAENNAPSLHLSRHYELCKAYSLDEHTAVPDVFIMSLHLWKTLTPEQQGWVQEAALESETYQRGLWAKATEDALEAVAKAGVEIIHPDKAAFATQVAPLLEEVTRTQPLVGDLARRIKEVKP